MAKKPISRSQNPTQQSRRFSRSRDFVLSTLIALAAIGIAMIPLNFWVGVAISTAAAVLLIVALIALIRTRLGICFGIFATLIGYFLVVWAIYVPCVN